MKLNELLDFPFHENPTIEFLTDDSRDVIPQTLFFSRRGHDHDGHRYILEAIDAGAVAVVGENPIPLPAAIPFI